MSIRTLQVEDHSEWLRMRQAQSPDCGDDMHALEMKHMAQNSGKAAVYVYQRQTEGLGAYIEVAIRARVDGSFSKRVGYIEGWYVDPDLRAQGIGRQLMEKAEAWVLEQGLTQIASDAEIPAQDSIDAHKAMGFEETFRLVHFLKHIG